jgi:integrase
MQVTFFLKTSNPAINGEYSIGAYCTFNGDKARPSTGIKVAPENFHADDEVQYVKKSDPKHKEKNESLNRYRKFLEDMPNPTKEKVAVEFTNYRKGIKPEKKKELSFFESWDMWVEECKDEVSDVTNLKLAEPTIGIYNSTGNVLREFEIHTLYKITAETLNDDFYKRFRKYILSERENNKKGPDGKKLIGQSVTTLSNHLKQIKKFCKWYQKKNPLLNNDWRDFKRGKSKTGEAEPFRAAELTAMYNTPGKTDRTEKARLILLTLVSTSMRISDYNKLNPEIHIVDGLIQYQMKSQKTTVQYMIPYFDDMYFRPVECIRKLTEKYGRLPKISGQKLNDSIALYLKEIEFTRVKVTSKTGRKTFATLNLLNKVNPEIIMKAGGWKSRDAFDAYVGIDTYDIIREYKDKAQFLQVSA